MSKHTEGPWQCYADLPSVEPNWHVITNATRMRVIANVHIEPGNAVDAANARLLTVAPKLLAACIAVNKCGNGGAKLSRAASDMVRAAIREAEGLDAERGTGAQAVIGRSTP